MSLHEANTPLHDAADWDDFPAVEKLLSNGADIEARDEDGQTALFVAALAGAGCRSRAGPHRADLDKLDNDSATPRAFVTAGSCGGVFQAAM
jgi:ankyrin repeat protein